MDDLKTLIKQSITPMKPIPTGFQADLRRLEPVSAMIFDVYGTLLISSAGEPVETRPAESQAQVQIIADILGRHGIADSPVRIQDRLEQTIHEWHRLERNRGIDRPEVDILEIWQTITGIQDMRRLKSLALAFELAVNPVYVMPGAMELTHACQAARIPMGIVSNAQFYTPLLLDWFFKADIFDDKLCFYSFREGHAKPSPALFERAAKALAAMGLPAEKALFVGNDMLNDIHPAALAGFITALFAGDQRSLRMRETEARVKGVEPDLIVTELRQLLPTGSRGNTANEECMGNILNRIPEFVDRIRDIREIVISNIVLIGQTPAPTFREGRRAECLVERLADFQVDECSIDDFGNPIGVIHGQSPSRASIFIVAHLDTFCESATNTLYTVTDKTISGMGVSDNSAAVGVLASLPEIFRHLNLSFESDIVLIAPVHSLGPGNLKGIRHLLKRWSTPVLGAVCLESVELGRLNYYSDGMIRGEISCSIASQKKMDRNYQPNAILIIHEVINAILKLRLPQKPRTQIVIGKIAGGYNHGKEAYDASIGFEIRSDSDEMVRGLYKEIKDIVNGINQAFAVDLKLKCISNLNSTQLAYNHPLVKCAARILYRLGIEAVSQPSETALSIFLQKGVPAITLGLTRENIHHQGGTKVEIEPMFKGIAQIPALITAMDRGLCSHE